MEVNRSLLCQIILLAVWPSEQTLFPSIYLVHHSKVLYPESKTFKPKRFLKWQFSSYEFWSFGGRHRSCIGMAFPMMEMKLVLATILRTWQLELTNQRLIKPVRRGLTVAPPSGLKLKIVEKGAA
jgi:cytochrome P450